MTLAGELELRRCAEELGMAFFPGRGEPDVVAGLVDGIPITARTSLEDRRTYQSATAAVFPPLDLGLDLREEAGAVGRKLRSLFRSEEVEIGDAEFDDAVRVRGDEPERTRALLTPDARRALLELSEASLESFQVADGWVLMHREHELFATFSWSRLLRALARTAGALREAARRLPPARALSDHRDPLERYADAHGLDRATTPLSAWGQIGGLEVGLFVRRLDGGGHALEVGTVVDGSMAFDLEILPRSPRIDVPDPHLAIPRPDLRPVTLEDVGIDRRFVIRSSRRAEELEDRLPGRARLAMARLSASSDVSLRHGVFTVRRALGDVSPSGLASAIDAAIEGAAAAVPALRGGYRGAAR